MDNIKIIGVLAILVGILLLTGAFKPFGIVSLGGQGDFTPILKGSISTISPMEAGKNTDVSFSVVPVNIEQTNLAIFYLKENCATATLNKNGKRTPLEITTASGIKEFVFSHEELTSGISKTASVASVKVPITQEAGDYVLEYAALGGEVRSILANEISGVSVGGYYATITPADINSIKLTLEDASKPITLAEFNDAQGIYLAQGYNSVEAVNAGKTCRGNQNIKIEIPIKISAPSGTTILETAKEVINSEDKTALLTSIFGAPIETLIKNIQETTAKLSDPLKDKINAVLTSNGINKATGSVSTTSTPLLALLLIIGGAVMVIKQ